GCGAGPARAALASNEWSRLKDWRWIAVPYDELNRDVLKALATCAAAQPPIQGIPQEIENEQRVVSHIAWTQSHGLLRQAVEPGQAHPLHPSGSERPAAAEQ